jgi:hypothetical protein
MSLILDGGEASGRGGIDAGWKVFGCVGGFS